VPRGVDRSVRDIYRSAILLGCAQPTVDDATGNAVPRCLP
jgi:hypothetical protein